MPVKFDPKIHHRKSIRLPGYDYSQAGAYFVTIVAWQRKCLFGEVLNAEMRPNQAGKILQWEWENLALSFKFIELGAAMVMPNHFHGILLFQNVGATRQGVTNNLIGTIPEHNVTHSGLDGSPLPRGPKAASLGAIVGQFKSRITKRLRKIPELSVTPIWQRNYYEHIIRNEREMQAKWDYILGNPVLWDEDEINPKHPISVQP